MVSTKKSAKKKTEKSINERLRFYKLAKFISDCVGSFWTFLAAVLGCLIWLISGPIFQYSDTWQLIVNTTTTIITFLMVFLIQNTQNRDTQILNLKIDELIRSHRKADNHILDIDKFSEEELHQLIEQYRKLKNTTSGG